MKNKTLIILDWDDTLFPTSWISKSSINLFDETQRETYLLQFSELDNVIYSLLDRCTQYGFVTIITNASFGWIVGSMNVLPNSSKLIKNKVNIVSARDTYSKENHMSKWKDLAFRDEVSHRLFGIDDIHNIVSIGDAHYEYNATINLHDWEKVNPKQRLLKTIKLVDNPSLAAVIDQIMILTDCIEKVCKKRKHVDLMFKTH